MTKLTVIREQKQVQYITEDLNGIPLEMVLIPPGTFVMGALEEEEGSRDGERPQHTVTVPRFLMGRYPIMQAQWRAVAQLPEIQRKLELEPSYFKGGNRPVERVSWYDAVEFCDRLSHHTRRNYRLPSEAEWEYACRAGTTTPFHFGETIATDLANYDGKSIYGRGVRGEYRKETTDVGYFGIANAFGLSDMHGNVLEWCLDDWHENYVDAPTDGSAWLNKNNRSQNKLAILRGGSWSLNANYCRSAYRFALNIRDDISVDNLGFRVVCSVK